MKTESLVILMADDDPDDRMMAREAFEESKLKNKLYFVEDGEELMDYLLLNGDYTIENAPRPSLILLDLNMPKKDGREALVEIKSNPDLKRIPVVVLTTSKGEEDILKSYNLGVNSFVTKPVTFGGLIKVIGKLNNYWFEIVKLPK